MLETSKRKKDEPPESVTRPFLMSFIRCSSAIHRLSQTNEVQRGSTSDDVPRGRFR